MCCARSAISSFLRGTPWFSIVLRVEDLAVPSASTGRCQKVYVAKLPRQRDAMLQLPEDLSLSVILCAGHNERQGGVLC